MEEKLYCLIDAILEMEQFFPNGLPHQFKAALDRARHELSALEIEAEAEK